MTESTEPKLAEVKSQHLRDMLGAALLAASTDKMLPALCAVHITCDGTTLTVEGTNRFILARATVELREPAAPFNVLVDRGDVKRIIAALPRTTALSVSWLQVTDDGRFEVNADFGSNVQMFRPLEGAFPSVERLIPADEEGEPTVAGFGFNPAWMTAICKMPGRRRNGPVRLTFGSSDSKPAVTRWGGEAKGDPEFVALIMPVRNTR